MVSFEPFQVDFGWPIVHYTNLRSRVLSKESVLIVPHHSVGKSLEKLSFFTLRAKRATFIFKQLKILIRHFFSDFQPLCFSVNQARLSRHDHRGFIDLSFRLQRSFPPYSVCIFLLPDAPSFPKVPKLRFCIILIKRSHRLAAMHFP